jgi:hypothetical protein
MGVGRTAGAVEVIIRPEIVDAAGAVEMPPKIVHMAGAVEIVPRLEIVHAAPIDEAGEHPNISSL